MTTKSAIREFAIDGSKLKVAIAVHPPRTYMLDLYAGEYVKDSTIQAFLWTPEPVWVRASIGFTVAPTTFSSTGAKVPVFSKELWSIKQASLMECIELIRLHLRAPRKFHHPDRDDSQPVPIKKLSTLLAAVNAESELRLFNVQTSSIQFRSRTLEKVPRKTIDTFMEFNERELNSYASKRLRKECRSRYNELGFIEVGYVGTEESC